jgi:hypothetical protein
MLKLAILIPEIGYAGAENQTLYIAKHIDKNKFHIDLLTLNRGIDERKDLPNFVRILDKRKGTDIGFFINLCNLLKRLRPDILHCISFTSYIWGILAGHIAGVEKIVV